MDSEAQLKLQAFLDGELPEAEARKVAASVASDKSASDLMKELRQTRQALKLFEPEYKLPETREFFWSKIERQISQVVPTPAAPVPFPWAAWLRRILWPATAFALITLVALFAVQYLRHGDYNLKAIVSHSPAPTTVASSPGSNPSEMLLADAGTFTYRDYSSGTTLVWLEYPAEREIAKPSLH
jgi:anti-sigma factor RsiW